MSYLPGVIWRGDSVIDGVPETLDMLRSMVSSVTTDPELLRIRQQCMNVVLNDVSTA